MNVWIFKLPMKNSFGIAVNHIATEAVFEEHPGSRVILDSHDSMFWIFFSNKDVLVVVEYY